MSRVLMVFFSTLLASLLLTPVVREFCRRIGMIDRPDPRRINKVPVPRGGGLAVVLVTLGAVMAVQPEHWRLVVCAGALAAVGLVDDRCSLPPIVKLLGQFVVAVATWWWGGLGFTELWPQLPNWLDFALTVFWIVGAINAFNLIDGLDGLASGLGLIACLGMAGALMFVSQSASVITCHLALAGALLGFLRYNYNPASVFLGDTGSMFIGYMVATLPLAFRAPNSFLVSVGVPLLAMGVPIFDTALAILRRTIRRMLRRRNASESANDRLMNADTDHLHHRILRAAGFNQRRAAWTLYGFAFAAVMFGIVAMSLESRAAGMWLVAVTLGGAVIFRNLARIEFFDAGRLLGEVAHDRDTRARRRFAKLSVPLYVILDLTLLTVIYLLLMNFYMPDLSTKSLEKGVLVRGLSIFAALVFFRTYVTIWSRAQLSNFIRLFVACFFGSMLAGATTYYMRPAELEVRILFSVFYGLASFMALAGIRVLRPAIRDLFYAFDCSRLKSRKDVSRILVYGGGLRYRSFRRELVRTTSANSRMIVGIIDDDYLLRGHYIGGIQVMGTLQEAPEIINRVNADAVVIACAIDDKWLKVVRQTLEPTGVKLTRFQLGETELP